MRLSTMKGMAAGGLLGLTVGAGLMMTPQGKRMKRVLVRIWQNRLLIAGQDKDAPQSRNALRLFERGTEFCAVY